MLAVQPPSCGHEDRRWWWGGAVTVASLGLLPLQRAWLDASGVPGGNTLLSPQPEFGSVPYSHVQFPMG